MPSKSSRAADPAVKNRARVPLSAADPQPKRPRNGRSHIVANPPYDIAVDGYDADTIPVFCKKHRISVAFYYKMKLQGKTPREMHLGKKRLISRGSAEAWRIEREAEAKA